MSNVFQLFKKGQIENPSNPDADETIAVANVMAKSAELGRAIKELSNHFDAIDYIIDTYCEPEARKLQDQLREALTIAALKLSQANGKLPSLPVSALPDAREAQSRP
jgi:hypothetical protein